MPKMKTHSSSKKRFKKTASGLFKRSKAYRRHHAWAKTAKQIRGLRRGAYLQSCDKSHVATLMPY